MPIYATQQTKYKERPNRAEKHKYTDWPNDIYPHLKTWTSPQSFRASWWTSWVEQLCAHSWLWGSRAPPNGTAAPSLRKHSCPWRVPFTTVTFSLTEVTYECSFSRDAIYCNTNHKWVRCVLLFLLPADLNARYQLVQWTLLHFHSGGKDFQINWRQHSAIVKEKNHRCHHRCSLLCPVHKDLIEKHIFIFLFLYRRICFSLNIYLIF